MSKANPRYKTNSPYSEAIGMRPDDKLEPILIRGEEPFYPNVYRYDRDMYPNINYFFSRYHYMYKLYKEFYTKNQNTSIKDFLEVNAALDIFDVFSEISFKYKNYKIYYSWGKIKKEVQIHGAFRIHDYFFFPTNDFLFLQDRNNGKTYIYRGEVF